MDALTIDIFTQVAFQYKPTIGANAMHVGRLLLVCKSMRKVIQRYLLHYGISSSGKLRHDDNVINLSKNYSRNGTHKFGVLIESLLYGDGYDTHSTFTRHVPRGDNLIMLQFSKKGYYPPFRHTNIMYFSEGITCYFWTDCKNQITSGEFIRSEAERYKFSIVDNEVCTVNRLILPDRHWERESVDNELKLAQIIHDIYTLSAAEFTRVKTDNA